MATRIYHTNVRKFMRAYKNSDLTSWIPGYMPPVHAGWYQVSSRGVKYSYRYWDGTHWMCSAGSASKEQKSAFQNWAWRGLSVKLEVLPSSEPRVQATAGTPFPSMQARQYVRKRIAATSLTHSLFIGLGVEKLSNPVRPQFRRSI